jgi:hypothetical protein
VAATLVVFILFALSLCTASLAVAYDAGVLPKGVFSLGVENRFYFSTDQRFGPHGNAEDLAGAFDNRALDSSVFPSLAALNPLVPGGHASIGDSSVHFEYDYNILLFTPAYGVTDRLTIGAEIPYYWVQNNVNASVNSGPGSSANVGLRTGPGPGPCALPVAVLPLACPNTRRFTTEDVQQILGPGLPGISGFGFKPIKSFTADGFGDISLGAKYQYLRTDDWRLAATGGVRFPTGRPDDPDNLADIFWSTGAYTLFARLHNDYLLSSLWNPRTEVAQLDPLLRTGNVLLNFTVGYDWVLPDDVTIRAGAENALPTYRARVHRDVGDRIELEIGGRWVVWYPFTVAVAYRYALKFEDRVSGPKTFPNNFAEQDTDSTEQVYFAELYFSTVQWYLQKRFPVPLNASITYRDRFAGSGPRAAGSPSQILKTRYLGVGLQFYF